MNDTESQALLDQLKDVRIPDVSPWPAVGWWVLLVLLLVLLFVARFAYRRYQARRWQREAFAELQRLRRHSPAQPVNRTLSDCSRLTRRVLLSVLGREQVASLQGRAWLNALDDVTGQALFGSGFGRLLEAGPYQRAPEVEQHDLESLFDAIEELIRAAGRRPGTQAMKA
ncbi:DUF4381 domain-containing protein [Granulosicoccus sp. 3-233]|uniref:DUF4381 domain-containing protein n=1 Tax=Granulosicoccus sp. 3-233 TaxID=3417969 RepID=UPI003D32925B